MQSGSHRFRPTLRVRRLMRQLGRRLRGDETDLAVLTEELELRDKALIEREATIRELKAQLAERNAEVDALRRIGNAVGSAMQSEDSLNALVEAAQRLTGTQSCHIYLFDPTRTELVLRASDEEGRSMVGKVRLRLGEGITGWVAKERRPVAVSREAYKDHRFKFLPDVTMNRFESILAVPLVYEDEVLGVVNVRTVEPHTYGPHQIRILSNLAAQAAGVITKARQLRELEQRAEQVSTLTEVTKRLAGNLYLEDQLAFLVNVTVQAMRYKLCTVMLLDEKTNELELKATSSTSHEYISKPNIPVSSSIAGQAVSRNTTITVDDVKRQPGYHFPDIAAREGLCSMASIPLRTQDRIIGVMNCYTATPHRFSDDELNILSAFANTAAVAIQHARLSVRSSILAEMHHRVKNNLQQVASLLRLQMRFTSDLHAKEALRESLGRILSIASVHDLLSREDLDSVPLNRLAESILSATQQGLVPPDKRIDMRASCAKLMLPLHRATSLALVLNELVQNAIEHGFAERKQGSILVNLYQDEEHIVMEVANDGVPLPSGFDPGKTPSLGLRIVEDLVRGGLRGSFRMFNRDGLALAEVRFPINERRRTILEPEE